MNAELKNNCKRFGLLLLVVVLLLSLFPVNVHAANVETGVAGLTADSSGNATWTTSGGAITGSVSANKTSGCTGDTFTKRDGKLTFTNVSNAPALLSFNYELGLNGGSATVDGADVTAKLFSIVQTARANGLKSEQYLSYCLENIRKVPVEELLPWNEKIPAEIRISRRDLSAQNR